VVINPVARNPSVGRARAGVLLASVLLLLTVTPLVGPEQAAAADEATIAITEVAPAALTAGGQLTIRGTVTAGSVELSNVVAQVRMSGQRLRGRADLAAVTANPSVQRAGPLVPNGVLQVADNLAPGASAEFTADLAVDSLPVGSAGVYVGAVEVRATPDDAPRSRLDFQNLFLNYWTPGAVAESTPVAAVWPLVDRPDLDANGDLINDDLAEQLRPGGRLDQILQAGVGSAVDWFVDPDLFQSAAALGADDWLSQAVSALSADSAAVHLLPLADVDVVALTRDNRVEDIAAALDRGRAVAAGFGVAAGTDVAWPDGGADQATLAQLDLLGQDLSVLPTSQYPRRSLGVAAGPATVQLPATAGGGLATLADDAVTAILSGNSFEPGAVVSIRQQVLAYLYLVALERTSDPRPQVVAPPRRWDPAADLAAGLLSDLATAPWLRTSNLAELQDLPPDDSAREAFSYAGGSEISPAQVESADPAGAASAGLTQVLEDPLPVVQPIEDAVLRSTSTAWRVDADSGLQYSQLIVSQATETAAGLWLVPRESVTLTGQSGTIPLTIANDLPQAVTVQVAARATPSVRLQLTDPGVVTVPAGRRVSVELGAQAAASGVVQVDAQLVTTGGDSYGPSESFAVRVQALGQVAGWVVAAILAALFVITVVRIVLRARQRAAEAAR
jgi:hypothetical protein